MKRVFISVLLGALFVMHSTTAFAQNRNLPGLYEILLNTPHQEVKDTVEILEVMSFYCGHCYQFYQNEGKLKGRYPHRLDFKYIPIQWGKASTKPSEAFMIALDMGKGEELKGVLFKAQFEEKRDIGNLDVLEELATSVGLGKEFGKRLRTNEKEAEAKGNIDLIRKMGVNSTPTVIMAGNILVSPSMTDGKIVPMLQNMDTILSGLFKKK